MQEFECIDCGTQYSTDWDFCPRDCPQCESIERIPVIDAERNEVMNLEDQRREDERLFGRRSQWY